MMKINYSFGCACHHLFHVSTYNSYLQVFLCLCDLNMDLMCLQETFEFLNILQQHGFPPVMGVLTHLDKFRDVKKLKKTKKNLKHRFWTEIYDGAKLFYLSGLINGK